MAKKIVKRPKRQNTDAVPKNCMFCRDKKNPDFLESEMLSRFISDRGKIQSRSRTGVCAKHQRKLTVAIKRARHLAFLPFVVQPD